LKDVANIGLNHQSKMIVGQVLLGIAGFGVTLYAYYVKNQHKKNPKYKALCDFGPNASCSRVLTSK
jgi:hypothetical protein